MVEEVDNDDVVDINTAEVYFRRAGKEPVTQHPFEDQDVVDSSDSGGGDGEGSGLEDENVVNPNEREFVEDSNDSWDGSDEDVTEPVQMGAGAMNSDYESEELHSLEESSSDDDIGDDTDDSSEDELKTPMGKGRGQKRTFLVFKPVAKAEHIKFEKDMLFTTPKQFKGAITDYAIHGSWGSDLQKMICRGGVQPVQPLIKRRPPGKPKKKRAREVGEPAGRRAGISKQCKACGKIGHNKRSCKGEIEGNSSLPDTTNRTSATNKTSRCRNYSNINQPTRQAQAQPSSTTPFAPPQPSVSSQSSMHTFTPGAPTQPWASSPNPLPSFQSSMHTFTPCAFPQP
ncbi:hypothetical protein SO802_021875 [Lithocarpus litseifolius]|uniref:CCHC-type domain-containing protein n=1 Tax=Lithocarpus litseifolius TaxID=425828 RepID=A0AAW2CKF0_9ROSI